MGRPQKGEAEYVNRDSRTLKLKAVVAAGNEEEDLGSGRAGAGVGMGNSLCLTGLYCISFRAEDGTKAHQIHIAGSSERPSSQPRRPENGSIALLMPFSI